jgi:hypothetical protein
VENWIAVFVMIVAIAAVVQATMMIGMFLGLRKTQARIEQLAEQMNTRVTPTLTAIQSFVEETRPHIAEIVADAAEITGRARGQVQRADRVMSEGLERLRLQLIRTDQIVTGALDTVEEAGTKLRRGVLGPVQSVVAVVRGIQTGLEFFRERRNERRPPTAEPVPESQDETLFI